MLKDTSYHMVFNTIWEFNPSSIYQGILAKQCFLLAEIHSKDYLMLSEISTENNAKCYLSIHFKHCSIL